MVQATAPLLNFTEDEFHESEFSQYWGAPRSPFRLVNKGSGPKPIIYIKLATSHDRSASFRVYKHNVA
jgi:hypothetical protein